MAEETGLIIPLGRWALNTACNQLAKWRNSIEAAKQLHVSVNVSGIQLARDDLVEAVREALCGSGLSGEHLKIEVRSEEHTSELQSLMRISYAVFCLKKKNRTK